MLMTGRTRLPKVEEKRCMRADTLGLLLHEPIWCCSSGLDTSAEYRPFFKSDHDVGSPRAYIAQVPGLA